jgi:hypothetical protein
MVYMVVEGTRAAQVGKRVTRTQGRQGLKNKPTVHHPGTRPNL